MVTLRLASEPTWKTANALGIGPTERNRTNFRLPEPCKMRGSKRRPIRTQFSSPSLRRRPERRGSVPAPEQRQRQQRERPRRQTVRVLPADTTSTTVGVRGLRRSGNTGAGLA